MYADKERARAYHREYYHRTKEARKQQFANSRAKQRQKSKEFIQEYLENHPCVDCGNSDVRVLQFDHREPADKLRSIGQLLTSTGKLKEELAKCDVRCANCHMIRTAQQFGWERALVVQR